MVIGDNTGLARPGVFDQAMVPAELAQARLRDFVGDLIEGYTDDKAKIARQWQTIDKSVAKVGCPFISSPGNRVTNTEATVVAWRERRGTGYFAFTYKGALFLLLNTEDPALPMPPKMAAQFNEMVDMMKTDPTRPRRWPRISYRRSRASSLAIARALPNMPAMITRYAIWTRHASATSSSRLYATRWRGTPMSAGCS